MPLLCPSDVLKIRVLFGPYSFTQATTAVASVVFAAGSAGSPGFGFGGTSCRPVATTFAVTMLYVWYANKHLDPAAAEIRAELEPVLAGAGSAATGARA